MTAHRVLTIKQPHVAAIFAGLKPFETRSWPTKYRGPLLIHAGKSEDVSVFAQRDGAGKIMSSGMASIPTGIMEQTVLDPDSFGGRVLPRGCILGVVDLIGCHPAAIITRDEHRGWGDFSAGRFAWRLANPRLFKTPIPARGMLGLWTYRGEIEVA